MNDQTQQCLTTGALSKAANVSESFVRSRANAGEIPHMKLSDGTRVFPIEAVAVTERLIAERRRA